MLCACVNGAKPSSDQRGGQQALAKLLHDGRESNALRVKGDAGGHLQRSRHTAMDKQLGHYSAGLTSTRTRMRSPGSYGSSVTWRRPLYT